MNFYKIWRLSQTLLLSQLRATARSGRSLGIIRRPLFILILDAAIFVVGSLGAYSIGSGLVHTTLSSSIASYISGALAILPALISGVIFVFGLILELNVGAQLGSSDTVNWLPITASDYVAGSTISIFGFYSEIPVLLLSITMSLAYIYGLFAAWEIAALLTVFGVLLSASILEILKAVLNRFSSSFYRKGGRAALAFRTISIVALIVVVQIFFFPTIYIRLLGQISPTFGPTWFVPFLWSSVSVSALINGEALLSLSFALLAVALSIVFFYGAIRARSKYWVPSPPAIRITSSSYAPKTSSLSGFLTQGQLAIMRKDLKGLTRRREMSRFLALPVVFFLIAFLQPATGGISSVQFFGYFIATYGTLLVAISSVGAEGKAISNLYQFPLDVKDFVVGKAITPIIFGSGTSVAFFVLSGVISRAPLGLVAVLSVSAVALCFEMALIGMTFGMKFPNFSETRSSFISTTGGLLGSLTSIVLLGVSLSPIFYTVIFETGFYNQLIGLIASLAIISVIALVFYRIVLSTARGLLSQLPT